VRASGAAQQPRQDEVTVNEPGSPPPPDAPNHPLAIRMGLIAWLSHNVIIGSVFGTPGVLLRPMQERMGVSTELASTGVPLVILGSAVLASVAGVLAARFSLRSLMAGSAVASAAAWLLLAFTTSFAAYIVAYGLLLGPAMSLAGAVIPPTLVTRWFNRNRGLAIGIVHLPIIVTMLPVLGNWVIERYGVEALFLGLAALSALVLLPAALLVIDHPPGETARETTQIADGAAPATGLSVAQILKNPYFWCLALAVGAMNTSVTLNGVHLVAMAESWGFTRDDGALLASVQSLCGMIGSIAFGLLADRLGGGRTVALVAFDGMVLWLLLLLGLPFPALLVVFGIMGMHGSAGIPAGSRAYADALGPASFSRAYGMSATVTLPIVVVCIIGTGTAYRLTGHYMVTILVMAAYCAIGVPLALFGARGRTRSAVIPA
jgi:predicted MFS family arabinose efflux permease